jgi:hypothetical protein
MKRFISIWMLCSFYTLQAFAHSSGDTSILHVHDGKLTEWDQSKFAIDNETKISYAIDNDVKYLYIGLLIPDIPTQMKLMRTGMSVYIDLKGKKRTGRSIEFPVAPEQDQAGFGAPPNGQRPVRNGNERPDPATIKMSQIMIRNSMAFTRFKALKLTGFDNNEQTEQELNLEGSIQVAYKCDTAEIVEIEYKIPLSMIGEIASLSNKQISIGCKIHEMKMPSTGAPMGAGGMPGGGAMPGAGRRGGPPPGAGSNAGGMNMDDMMKEQSFWTKYTFTGI